MWLLANPTRQEFEGEFGCAGTLWLRMPVAGVIVEGVYTVKKYDDADEERYAAADTDTKLYGSAAVAERGNIVNLDLDTGRGDLVDNLRRVNRYTVARVGDDSYVLRLFRGVTQVFELHSGAQTFNNDDGSAGADEGGIFSACVSPRKDGGVGGTSRSCFG